MSLQMMINAIGNISPDHLDSNMIKGLSLAAHHFPYPKLINAVAEKLKEAIRIEEKREEASTIKFEYNIYLNEGKQGQDFPID